MKWLIDLFCLMKKEKAAHKSTQSIIQFHWWLMRLICLFVFGGQPPFSKAKATNQPTNQIKNLMVVDGWLLCFIYWYNKEKEKLSFSWMLNCFSLVDWLNSYQFTCWRVMGCRPFFFNQSTLAFFYSFFINWLIKERKKRMICWRELGRKTHNISFRNMN